MAGNGAGCGYLQVQTTTDSRAEAMELARAAVQARIAACGQVAGPIASTYWWDEDVERAEEWFVFFKLPADRYDELAAFLTQRHSYDEPEIIAVPIVAGTAGYLDWLREETRALKSLAALGGLRRRHVPALDDRFAVLGGQFADRAGAEQEQLPVRGRQPQPAGREHAQHVAVGDERHVPFGQQ